MTLLPREGGLEIAADEAVIAGVTIYALHREGVPAGWIPDEALRIVLGASTGAQFAVQLAPIPAGTAMVADRGARLWITPFAMKVPPGPCRILGRAYHQTSGYPYGWSLIALRSEPFEAAAGQVTYVGGIGILNQILRFATPADRNAGCPPAGRGPFRFMDHACMRDAAPFLWDDEARDLPLIRQAFPALQTHRILRRTVPAGAPWSRWPAVLDPMA